MRIGSADRKVLITTRLLWRMPSEPPIVGIVFPTLQFLAQKLSALFRKALDDLLGFPCTDVQFIGSHVCLVEEMASNSGIRMLFMAQHTYTLKILIIQTTILMKMNLNKLERKYE